MKENNQFLKKLTPGHISLAIIVAIAIIIVLCYFLAPHTIYLTPDLPFMPEGEILTKPKIIKIRNESSVSVSVSIESEVTNILTSTFLPSELSQTILNLHEMASEARNSKTSKKTKKIEIPAKALVWDFNIIQNHFAVYTWIEQRYNKLTDYIKTKFFLLFVYNNDLIAIEAGWPPLGYNMQISISTITK